ncbi:MAG: hypothetical protein PHW96_04580 [Candidatus Nanoarchaeia archaeon]|nr:hypothetical protein [Candidatus Nanoarchaeia archaeon]
MSYTKKPKDSDKRLENVCENLQKPCNEKVKEMSKQDYLKTHGEEHRKNLGDKLDNLFETGDKSNNLSTLLSVSAPALPLINYFNENPTAFIIVAGLMSMGLLTTAVMLVVYGDKIFDKAKYEYEKLKKKLYGY